MSRLSRFLIDESGGATTLVAVAVVVMVLGGTGLIIDHRHLVAQRDLLKSASTTAAVVATRELNNLPRSWTESQVHEHLSSIARKYAVVNVIRNTNEDIQPEDVQLILDIDREAGTVGATVRADIGHTVIGALFGYSGPGEWETKSGVESVNNAVEVVLAIDISNSMASRLDGGGAGLSPSRMEIVKGAAATLVDILNPNEDNRVAVGVVPWQIVVRLDAAARAEWGREGWAEYPRSRHYAAAYACTPEGRCTALAEDQALPATPGEAWQGCLDEHRVSQLRKHADLPPESNLLDHPSESAFAQSIFTTLQGVAYQCLAPPLPGNFYYQICYDEASATELGRTAAAPQKYCDDETAAILPLTSDRVTISAALDGLEPVGFRTYSTLGVLWGQRLLSHSWKSVWGGDVHPVDPEAEANAGTRKAIVLLTDGEDNPCGLYDPTCSTNDVGILRTTACSTVKAAGTEIFVIAAMHPNNVSGNLGEALRECSSEADNPAGSYVFLNNTDPENLEAAFASIATELKTIRRVY